jgi:hypothetical protein
MYPSGVVVVIVVTSVFQAYVQFARRLSVNREMALFETGWMRGVRMIVREAIALVRHTDKVRVENAIVILVMKDGIRIGARENDARNGKMGSFHRDSKPP